MYVINNTSASSLGSITYEKAFNRSRQGEYNVRNQPCYCHIYSDINTNTTQHKTSGSGPTRWMEIFQLVNLAIKICKYHSNLLGDGMLDLILTNEEGMIDSIEHNAPLGKSDHEVLEFTIKCGNRQQTYNKKSRKYFKGNYVEINKSLSATNWNTALSMGSVDDMWNSLADKLQRLS